MIQIPPDLVRTTLDAAPDATLIVDALGTIRFTNFQVSTLFGYAHDEIIGESIEKLMPERYRAQHMGYRECYVSNLRTRAMGVGVDLFGQRRDGTEFPLEISLSPIEGAGGTFIAASIRDVSDRERIEAELIEARAAAESARELADRANHAALGFRGR
jgi:PAS domain S-box-containing protein